MLAVYVKVQGGELVNIYRRKSRVAIIDNPVAAHRRIHLDEYSYEKEDLCSAKETESSDHWQT